MSRVSRHPMRKTAPRLRRAQSPGFHRDGRAPRHKGCARRTTSDRDRSRAAEASNRSLATALNLFPIGQLDGGHISYSVLGHRSIYVTYAAVAVLGGLTFFAGSWAFFALLTIAMLIVLGRHHPLVWDEHVPLDRTRLIMAFCALVIFVLCFTPAPITISDIIKH